MTVTNGQRESWGRLADGPETGHSPELDEFIAEARMAIRALLAENAALTKDRDFYLTEARGWIKVAYANASETDAAKAEADQLRAQVAELTARAERAESSLALARECL